jgi:hypothetical protein
VRVVTLGLATFGAMLCASKRNHVLETNFFLETESLVPIFGKDQEKDERE